MFYQRLSSFMKEYDRRKEMADYYGKTITNEFLVTDEEEYKKLFAGLVGCEDRVYDWSREIDGKMYHSFGSYSTITYCDKETYKEFKEIHSDAVSIEVFDVNGKEFDDSLTEEELDKLFVSSISGTSENPVLTLTDDEEELDEDFDLFLNRLKKILPDDQCFILQEVGNEKLRYFVGFCLVLTNKECKNIELNEWAFDQAKELVKNVDPYNLH